MSELFEAFYDTNKDLKFIVEIKNKGEEGKTAVAPAEPKIDSFIFEGWYSNQSLTIRYDFSSPVTADISYPPFLSIRVCTPKKYLTF